MPSANNFTSHGGAASGTQIVDRVLGEAYNKVRVVYDNLGDISSVADNIADINSVVDNLSLLGSVVQDVQEQIELAIDGKKDLFIAGVDYVKDTSTELTLTNTPAQLNSVQVFFNGIYQNKNTYSRLNRVITFNIPIVVDKVEIHYNVPSMYVDLSGTAAHEFETNVENSKNGAEAAKITAIAQANAATAAKVIAETSANTAVLAASAASASAVNAAVSEVATLAAVDMAVDGKKDLFTAGVHYTINVSTTLTLTTAPAQQNAVHVYFDGVYQNRDTYTLAGTTLTFTSAIDVGSVEVQYAVPSMYVDLSSPIAQAFEANVDAAAVTATAQASLATSARVVAEAARDSINTTGKVFTAAEGTAAGIAATTSGQQFAVLNASGNRWEVYRNEAGTALAVGPGNYTAGYIDEFIDKDYESDLSNLYAIVDSEKRLLAKWVEDGTLIAKLGIALGISNGLTFDRSSVDGKYTLSLGTTEGELPVSDSTLLGAYDNDDALFVLTDSAGRKLLTITNDGTLSGKITTCTEVVTSRGSRTSLDARLSQHLNAYGQPKNHQWGGWYMRETRQRLRKRLLGESAQLVVASIGDSWTHNRDRWCAPVASTFKTTYGNAGSGWVGFAYGSGTPYGLANGNINSADASLVHSGTWLTHYTSSVGPDIGDVYSSTPGDKLTVGFLGAGNTSVVNLYYVKGAGVVRYRWNAGSWTTADLSAGSGLGVLALAGFPTGTWTLEIESVSGITTLCGVDLQQTADGIRWHKLGATGSRASHWAGVDATQWQAGLTALAPHLVTILLATNDQAAYDAATYKTHVQTLITRVKAALPLADVLLICPCENGRANTYPMTDYSTVLYELAATNKCGFIDLQYVFGESFGEYASTSPRAWFNADLIHPEPMTGGRAIADVVARFLTTV